jgi:peptide/nickel transport system permease protein
MYFIGFFFRRLSQGVLIIFLVSLLIFTLLRVVPGDPTRLIVGGMAPDNVVKEMAHKLGLDDPIPLQFARYIGAVIKGDLGHSFIRPANGSTVGGSRFNDPSRTERAQVLDLIAQSLPMTLQLAGVAFLMALAISLPLGIAGGLYPNGWQGKLAFYLGSLFVSLPNFWLGIVLAITVSVKLALLPSIGYHGFAYTLLPAFVLAIEISPFIIRTLTVSVAQVMNEPFVESSLLRGLTLGQTIRRHVLRNASIPLLNLFGVQLSTLLGGVLVIEFIFDYPGLGLLTINAVLQRDFPLIQGIAILTSGIFVLINILVDLAAASVDPRLDTQ